MASSNDNEDMTTRTSLGAMIVNEIQEIILDNTENMSQSSGSSIPTAVNEEVQMLTNRLGSIFNESNTPNENNGTESPTNDEHDAVSQAATPTDELQAPRLTFRSGHRHIMISYSHDETSDICRRICTQLRNRGYQVWMDTNNLRGALHQRIAEAIENSYIVLFCINSRYSNSDFCEKEALYTDKRQIDFIPCLLETSYVPDGWLGILIRDRLYIDFSSADHFDTAFEQLIEEIKEIKEIDYK
ncbi:unnamed protein product [Adineta steineri]|uniref:TIR domain-containing protein n=1 Tax=Adineta steineri TaxID=433720 RepID=A0A815W6I7_9BILA|nr:unnamed protein product [Adineta steineri]CAF1541951.1 unnamed protein product [Adineta steineri]